MADRVGQAPTFSPASSLRAAMPPAAATVIAFSLEFFRNPAATQHAPALTLLWVGVLLVAAPVTAYVRGRRRSVAGRGLHAVIIGTPQLPLIMVLATVDVWLDVRSGYLLAGSGEEAMSYGISTMISAGFGLVLAVLVALAAFLGSRHSRPSA